jgi:hypothetical protein
MKKRRNLINERLSVSDSVIEITDEIYDLLINKLRTSKLFIEKEKNVLFKKGILTYYAIKGRTDSIPNINIKYIVYYFDNIEDYNIAVKYNVINTNCYSDIKNNTIGLYLVMINNHPYIDFKSSIQHEVNHFYQNSMGQVKNEDFYEKVVKLTKSTNIKERNIALALYYTFTTEQDAFISQYYAYLKSNNISQQKAKEFFQDKNCPYYNFDCLFDYIIDIYDEIDDIKLQKSFGITKERLYSILDNADKRFTVKLSKAVNRYIQERNKVNEKKYPFIGTCHSIRLQYLMECYQKGITEFEEDFFD